MKIETILLVGLLGLVASGCSVGDAPSGMSAEDAKAAVAKLPLEERIKLIESSPLRPEEKAKKIAELRAANP